jgi:hypothetical protein
LVDALVAEHKAARTGQPACWDSANENMRESCYEAEVNTVQSERRITHRFCSLRYDEASFDTFDGRVDNQIGQLLPISSRPHQRWFRMPAPWPKKTS